MGIVLVVSLDILPNKSNYSIHKVKVLDTLMGKYALRKF